MTVLEITIRVLLILTLLSVLLFILFLFFFIKTAKEVKFVEKKRSKNTKRKRQLARKRKQLRIEKKRMKRRTILFMVLATLFLGGSQFVSYYQSMTLSKEDEDVIVKSYFLLNDFDQQLENAKTESESKDKIDGNIRYLAGAITSYGANKASDLNTEEGQLALNRYYKAMLDIGTNAMRMTTGIYGNEEIASDYQADIKRARVYQKKVFELYKVDESALKKSKSNS
ncbi:hypothetical protein ATZ33_16960 [Enterococcus silesiacus]|uniref:Uncharacterized protein n=1 Tax=Enterococcus silesiacus TaxID=332949 RepID=A0A0S3KFF7_9ENTE|nr:hypothetical protein [Enterococcus silesiacus]ALS03007.1 hypothetical protein ATZ33_16960 [Enterococcus silesiacus]OJG92949.1 hypothetical protein RV15_GL002083 [Enterococcus silesiacus]